LALTFGTRLGVYEVTAQIGEGGMGQVYRARDTKLDRDVAIKLLPEAFAHDADRLARFQREAKTLASLNHPNIAQIFGLEQAGDLHALAMELVAGEDLSQRIARGAIPFDEALPIARQIAEALEAAHEQGIIHRDLKPANIKVRSDGTVKVLDFGLAKAMEPAGAMSASVSVSPTITTPAMTQAGMILGTAAYMSPEQARGKPVDKRADIWAFGCVVYEMVTGRRAFAGDDVTEVLANVLKTEPNWTATSGLMPPRLRRLLARTLDRNAGTRIAHASILRFELDELLRDLGHDGSSAPAIRPRAAISKRMIPFAIAALVGAAAVGAATWIASRPPPASTTRLSFLPGGALLVGRKSIAIAPNGRRIAYIANRQVYVRDLGSFEATPVAAPRTADVYLDSMAFSPDSDWIAFWSSDGVLERVPVAGGAAVTIGRFEAVPNGLSWQGNDILFIPSGRQIMRVSSRGGTPHTLVTLAEDEEAYAPQLLPDGDHVLFTVRSRGANWSSGRIVAQSRRSGERKVVIDAGQDARYLSTGHLVYAAGAVLFAIRFDATQAETRGAAVAILDGVLRSGGSGSVGAAAQFAVADAGTLAYVPGVSAYSSGGDIGIVARDGAVTPLGLPIRPYQHIRVSPDGRSIAFAVDDGKESSVYVYDIDGRSAPRRLTFGGNNRYPVWSGDGTRVTFQSDRGGRPGLFTQVADGSAPAERLTTADAGIAQVPESWSPAGDRLLYTVTRQGNVTLWAFSPHDKTSTRFADVESSTPTGAVFSPDGLWVAYAADNTVFVQPFPTTGARYQVSTTKGAHHPLWSRDGRELWYEPGPSQLVAVPVTTRPTFAVGSPVPVPSANVGSVEPGNLRSRDVMPNGRWVTPMSVNQTTKPSSAEREIRVVLNWLEDVKRLVPTR